MNAWYSSHARCAHLDKEPQNRKSCSFEGQEESCFSTKLERLFRCDAGDQPNPEQNLSTLCSRNIWFSLCVAFIPRVVPRAVCNAFLSQQDSKDGSSAKRC
ncbi:hypothetical protein ATANTOWER_019151 [Ataeniobius toweri]|uniref:Uncharacterized protein n=1 Tax=Ataeniobius toweri TaxID=208326 RepID=A0ABU7ABD1_9TELE|nr:hypothetical protein [Ataeniobius toweri]